MGWVGLVGAVVTGCTPATKMVGQLGDSDDAGESGTTQDVDDSMTGASPTDSSSTIPDDDGTGGAEAEEEGPWDETGTFPGTEGGGTGDYVECVDEDLATCSWEGTDCVFQRGWNCAECIGDVSKPLCYEASIGCEYPWLECPELPVPCGVVRLLGAGTITGFEDESAATCLLESVRDSVAGVYTIEWGEESADATWPHVEVLVGSDGTVTMQLDKQYVCSDCEHLGIMVRSFGMGRQPASFFDDCLEAPTTESLALCILGFTEFDTGSPAPLSWTPPFTTGECVNEMFECPPA